MSPPSADAVAPLPTSSVLEVIPSRPPASLLVGDGSPVANSPVVNGSAATSLPTLPLPDPSTSSTGVAARSPASAAASVAAYQPLIEGGNLMPLTVNGAL